MSLKITPKQEAAIIAAIEQSLAICQNPTPQPTDAELDALLAEWIGEQEGMLFEHLRGYARAVLERWGK